MKKHVITLKDIAKRSDLSVSTVSRALNDHPDISNKTKERVKRLANDLNYFPNLFAKGFRSHKTKIIGVIVPNITNYFTATILKGILEQASLQGYRVLISETNNDIAKQKEMLKTMLQFNVDGILMSVSKMTKKIDYILNVLDCVPLILFDKASDKIPCSQVVIDDEQSAYTVIEHLINIGKKRIAIIKESKYSYNSEKRYAGYLRALKDNNIEIDQKLIISVKDISLRQGKRMTKNLLSLKEPPDAIFAITDSAAIGVIKSLKKFKIKIPNEIAVVGFSNSINSTIIEPHLTTIDQPGKLIGSTAIKYLLKEINNESKNIDLKHIEIKGTLIIRESTFKPI